MWICHVKTGWSPIGCKCMWWMPELSLRQTWRIVFALCFLVKWFFHMCFIPSPTFSPLSSHSNHLFLHVALLDGSYIHQQQTTPSWWASTHLTCQILTQWLNTYGQWFAWTLAFLFLWWGWNSQLSLHWSWHCSAIDNGCSEIATLAITGAMAAVLEMWFSKGPV